MTHESSLGKSMTNPSRDLPIAKSSILRMRGRVGINKMP